VEAATAPAAAANGASDDNKAKRGRARAQAAPEPTAQQAATPYVILQKITIPKSALPEGHEVVIVPGDTIEAWVPLYNEKSEHGRDGELRIIPSRTGDKAAIKVATKLDEADAQRPGTFKGVPQRNWAGSLTFKNKETVVTETEESED
jgi:hypothetical protein